MLSWESVRLIRLELTRLPAPDPKSGVSTNSTTSALCREQSYTFLTKRPKEMQKKIAWIIR